MSEPFLEEFMLSAAQDQFFSLTEEVEKSVQGSNSIFELTNQIELLKDISSQADLQLQCYKSHDRLLRYDLASLSSKKVSLLEEIQKIRESFKKPEAKVSVNQIESLIKEKHFIEDQLVKYKMNLEQLKTFKETCLEQLKETCCKVKIKEREVINLSLELKRRNESRKAPSKVRSLLIDKLGLTKEPFARPSTGTSKTSTMESSKSSFRFF